MDATNATKAFSTQDGNKYTRFIDSKYKNREFLYKIKWRTSILDKAFIFHFESSPPPAWFSYKLNIAKGSYRQCFLFVKRLIENVAAILIKKIIEAGER